MAEATKQKTAHIGTGRRKTSVARVRIRPGDGKLVDSMIYDGLWDAFNNKHMGDQSDDVNKEFTISREEQDEWSARSHQRAQAATEDGRFKEEIVPLSLPQRKGDPIEFADLIEEGRGTFRTVSAEIASPPWGSFTFRRST